MDDPTKVTTRIGREAAGKAKAFVETNEAAKKATDAFYTLVGLGVIGVQKATKATKKVSDTVDANVTDGTDNVKKKVADVSSSLKDAASKVDGKVDAALKSLDNLVAPYQEKLPESAKAAVKKAREATDALRSVLKDKLLNEDDKSTSDDSQEN